MTKNEDDILHKKQLWNPSKNVVQQVKMKQFEHVSYADKNRRNFANMTHQ